jgi:hypothetical protein
MTALTVFQQLEKLAKDRAAASKAEVSIEELRRREELRLGVTLVPVKGEQYGE